ncbi:MAG TPA: NAD(P)-dependent oxidoreductase [Nitrospiraceae bacterium]|nr:NAD(P)-dependent oxidoreductase [Nitrospiraceae bacterium]
MKIVVTGATGFVGGQVVRRLMSDHELYCVTRKGGALPVHPQVHRVEQDLVTIDAGALPKSVDAILHLAQSRQFRKFPDQARDIFKVNTDSTLQLLEYGRQAKCRVFVYASSGGVCGYLPRPIVETDPPQIINFYLASKYAAECLVNSYGDFFAPINLRYFFVYGEGQRDMFMPGLVTRVLEGSPVTTAGKTGVSMNPVHVSDAVEATVRAMDLARGETINVAGGETTTVYDLAELIGQVTGHEPQYQYEPDKGSLAMVGSIENMKQKLGVTPKITLKEGIERLAKDVMDERSAKSR